MYLQGAYNRSNVCTLLEWNSGHCFACFVPLDLSQNYLRIPAGKNDPLHSTPLVIRSPGLSCHQLSAMSPLIGVILDVLQSSTGRQLLSEAINSKQHRVLGSGYFVDH